MESLDTMDSYRTLNGNTKHYTWHKTRVVQRARLDMFLNSKTMEPYLDSYKKHPPFLSDHSPIELNLDLEKFKQGKGYWKLDVSLLQNPEYTNIIKNAI